MEDVKVFIRGWLGYFHISDMKRIVIEWDNRMRRRFRMYIWKLLESSKTRVGTYKSLGFRKGSRTNLGT